MAVQVQEDLTGVRRALRLLPLRAGLRPEEADDDLDELVGDIQIPQPARRRLTVPGRGGRIHAGLIPDLQEKGGYRRGILLRQPQHRLAGHGLHDGEGLVPRVVKGLDNLLQEEIYQVMLGCYKQDYPLVMKDVTHAKIAAWWDRAVDIIPANGGKGAAIQRVLGYYHLNSEQAIAFGDGNNDIEMLKAVGTGVAMANSSEHLKEVADEVCGHAAQDRIYYCCLEHGLI